ncbi:hypothetical protein C7820_2801 [Paenibacillus sp. VMFN-D1]|nr:hypothetical protein C7820_2801 [Paenibacillus sp. VMFN-D1]
MHTMTVAAPVIGGGFAFSDIGGVTGQGNLMHKKQGKQQNNGNHFSKEFSHCLFSG